MRSDNVTVSFFNRNFIEEAFYFSGTLRISAVGIVSENAKISAVRSLADVCFLHDLTMARNSGQNGGI